MFRSMLLPLAFCSLFLLWRAECSVVLLTSSNCSFSFSDVEASFASKIPASGIMGRLIAAEPLNACQPLTNIKIDEISGFLLSKRGDCNFITKVKHAQDAGYAAAIVYNNEDSEDLITMSGSGTVIDSYAVFISKKAGETLHASINDTDSRCYLFPTFENAAKSLVVILVLSLLTVFAIFSTLFFVQRHHYRRPNSVVQEREASGMAWKDVKVLAVAFYGDDIEEFSTTCAICLEDYEQGERLRVLPCGHEFHVRCIDQWLTTQKCFCPICKMDAHLKVSNKGPSEHTPLLASRSPSFNTMSSMQTIAVQNQHIRPCSCVNGHRPLFPDSQFCQEDEDLMQAANYTSGSVASCSPPFKVSGSGRQEVAVVVNSD